MQENSERKFLQARKLGGVSPKIVENLKLKIFGNIEN